MSLLLLLKSAQDGKAVKVWNGSAWVMSSGTKVWDGSTWTTKTVKVWNGSTWTT